MEKTNEIIDLFGNAQIFSFPKPTAFINFLITIGINDKTGIILDFFSGSCTTAHAVLDLNKQDNGNRKFICVQLPEKSDEKSEAFKAGYKTIADIGKERIRRVIKKIKEDDEGKLPFEKTKQDLGFKVFKRSEFKN
jgi:adenine-specific DNA-methyltransferase